MTLDYADLQGVDQFVISAYAQMGGMLCATFITLLLVPVIYSIFVLDLKLIKWETAGTPNSEAQQPERRSRTGIQGCFLRASLRAHRTILPSTIQELTREAVHQRNTSPILHPLQKI